jgi:hypothetical protein
MNAWSDVLWELMRMGAVAAGVFYAVQVVITYVKSNGRYSLPLETDRNDLLASAHRATLWIGVLAVGGAVRVTRPLLQMLAEASAEVGEWALARSRLDSSPHLQSRRQP